MFCRLIILQEATTGRIDLSSEKEEVVAALEQFLYSFNYDYDYNSCIAGASSPPGPLEFHVMVALLADQYNIDVMKHGATNQFSSAMDSKPYNMTDLDSAVRLAYSAREVLKYICICIVTVMVQIQSTTAFDARRVTTEVLIGEVSSLSLDIVSALGSFVNEVSHRNDMATFKCGNCSKTFAADIEEDHNIKYSCPFCKAASDGQVWCLRFQEHDCTSAHYEAEGGRWWRAEWP